MKSIFRSLSHYKFATILNVLGLSIAFMAFTVLSIQIRYEYSFDRFHPNAEQIYRVDMTYMDDNKERSSSIISPSFINTFLSQYPQIDKSAMLFCATQITPLKTEDESGIIGFLELTTSASPGITEVFGFKIIEGDKHCLKYPQKALIPESTAKRIFGNKSAIGKYITTESHKNYIVGAVYKDFPTNTQLSNAIYFPITNEDLEWMGMKSSNFFLYLLLDNKQAASDITKNYNDNAIQNANQNEKLGIRMTSLPDIYFASGQDAHFFKVGDKQTIGLFTIIALLIIIIAAINFINFSTAITPMRLKSINTRKVLGCSVFKLRKHLIMESLMICICAWIISLFILWFIGKINLLSFIDADISLANNVSTILFTGIISVCIGIIASVYPAYYQTSFQPALAMKGNFGLTPSGRRLRTALISIQYIISITLIIAALIIQKQNSYMQNFDSGFDTEQIAIVELNNNILKDKDTYANKLKEHPGIEDVGFARWRIGAHDNYTYYTVKYKEKDYTLYTFDVSPNFLDIMNIPIEQGRNFNTDGEPEFSIILNSELQKEMQIHTGESIDWLSWSKQARVIGITGEIKVTSLRQGEDKISFILSDFPLPISYIKLKAGTDINESTKYIRKTLAELDNIYPFEIEFYDSFYNNLYKEEVKLNNTITSFSILAIIISIVGVFGLVLFETQYRRKEIGIRKINGASVKDILSLFILTYLKIVSVCFIIAVPLAYYAVSTWLEAFSYKTPIHWWIFLLAFLIVLLITAATVIIQNWRTAIENPVNSIRTE